MSTRAALSCFAMAALLAGAPSAPAYQNLESPLRTNGSETLQAFEPVRRVLQECSAVILDGRDQLVYGAVISSNGLIVTKASEIEGHSNLIIRVGDELFDDVEVLNVDPAWDVALLKIDASDLVPVRWAATSDIPQGTWVVANGATSRSRRRAMVGVISANSREVAGGPSVALGVVLSEEGDGLTIQKVTEGSGAAEAGLQEGDRLLSFGGATLEGREQLLELLKTRRDGERVAVRYERDGKTRRGDILLQARSRLVEEQVTRNDQMSGRISTRRSSFKRVIQHDTPGNSESVGGPLLNLDGECLGLNIARANRVETFAIPLEELQEVIERLKSSPPGSN